MSIGLDLSRDLALLKVLQQRLAKLGVHAEVREHLLSLVVFRGSQLPVCVFISNGGRSYSWDSGRNRQLVADVERAADQLAELVTSTEAQTVPHPSAEGEAP
jgi:hypothetical protein